MNIPKPPTLKKYGLSEEEWIALYNKYDGACHVCLKKYPSDKLNIEHEHVPNWKKLSPEEKKLLVRGLACYICNYRILTRGVTIEKLENAVRYLKDYEWRKSIPS